MRLKRPEFTELEVHRSWDPVQLLQGKDGSTEHWCELTVAQEALLSVLTDTWHGTGLCMMSRKAIPVNVQTEHSHTSTRENLKSSL